MALLTRINKKIIGCGWVGISGGSDDYATLDSAIFELADVLGQVPWSGVQCRIRYLPRIL